MQVWQTSWQRCWQGLAAQGEGQALMQQLLAAYAQAPRAYHTLQHLAECLACLASCRHELRYPAEVEMALWFHDAVYDVYAQDNEARSAAWARQALAAAGVTEEALARIQALIMATCHSALPEPGDQQWLVDIDLAILGAEPARFAEYEAQIRDEYAWVPALVFAQKRAQILQGFLARPRIFSTDALAARFELPARRNLQAALQSLSVEG